MYKNLSPGETDGASEPLTADAVQMHVMDGSEQPDLEAPPVAHLVKSPLEWDCPRCTLICPKNASACKACGCPQPGVSLPGPVIVHQHQHQHEAPPPAYGTGPAYTLGSASTPSLPVHDPAPDPPRANPNVGGYFNGGRSASNQSGRMGGAAAYPNPGQGRAGAAGEGLFGMFQNGGMGMNPNAGAPTTEEEARKENCARVGCMCSCCCPCIGVGTYIMNRDAQPGTRRNQLAKIACMVASVMMLMNFAMLVFNQNRNKV